ncbi:MAG: DUF4160 domain-containing protein [Sphingobacteriales bacterium]|nr:MAG: DUF4160 domain-containing protein [Sphingobacteriales bacterium]
MPKIAFYKYLLFYIVSYDLNERMHLHVGNTKSRKGKDAKIWIDTAEVFSKGDLSKEELNMCCKLIEKNREEIVGLIHNFAKGKKEKPIQLKLK